jgi:hypothetical protein
MLNMTEWSVAHVERISFLAIWAFEVKSIIVRRSYFSLIEQCLTSSSNRRNDEQQQQ